MALYLPVIYGSVRAERKSFPVASYVARRLAARPGVETRLFDPRALPFGNLVYRVREWPNAPPEVNAFAAEMRRADGFVLVTPEYNYGLPGALKNVLDHLWEEWSRKPFGLVGAGGLSGGLRALDALRLIVPGLGGITVSAHVAVPHVGSAFDDRGPVGEIAAWEKKFDRLFDDLAWYALALRGARVAAPPDPT